MFNADKKMDHTNYPRRLRTKSETELRFIVKDCQDAIRANPENPNSGYYADEIHYAAAELRGRAAKIFSAAAARCEFATNA